MSLATVEAGAAALRAHLGLGADASCDHRLLAAGPGRQVVDYRFHAAPPLVGKFYPDGAGGQAFATMARLRAALRAAGPALLAIPEPTWYDPACRLLVMRLVEGRPLAELARGAEARRAMWLAGRALAELHRLTPPAWPRLGLREHLRDLVRPHPRALAAIDPGLGRWAEALLGAMLAAEDHGAPAALIHRDLHLRQLHLWGGQIWMLDWDLAAVGDAALDLGNLCASMHTRLPEPGPAVSAFLEGYAISGSACAIARAPLFAAFTYLRLACKAARLGRAADAPGLIARAARALETGDTHG